MSQQTDVLIVGAGPVGLMLACELRRREVACRVIDKCAEFPATSRASALMPRAVEVLDSLGVADPIRAEGSPAKGVRLMRDGREVLRIDGLIGVDATPDRPERGGIIVNQAVVEGALRDKLAELGGAVERHRELRGFEQTPDGVIADVADLESGAVERVTAEWLVGCDGAHSVVRELLRLPFDGKDYPDQFVQADLILAGDMPAGIATQWINPQGWLGAVPFREPGLWRLIAQVYPDAGGAVPPASVELFERLLAERGHDTTTRIVEPRWLSNFAVQHRMVRHYRRGRVFVAGDAAHVHSPLGGQGLNTGIQDSYNLGWKLALVLNGAAPEALLDSYEAERLPVARTVLKRTDVNHRIRLADSRLADVLMDRVLLPLLRIPVVADRALGFLLKRNSQLDVSYRSSVLSGETGVIKNGPAAGDRAPDGRLLDGSGATPSLLDQFRSPQFRLLVFQGRRHPADPATLAAIARRTATGADGLVRPLVIALDTADRPGGIPILTDPAGRTHATYGADEACLYLVRPDGYVGFRCLTSQEPRLADYLRSNFGVTAASRTPS